MIPQYDALQGDPIISYAATLQQPDDTQQPTLQIVQDDPYLVPYQHYFHDFKHQMLTHLKEFEPEGGLEGISKSYHNYGLHRQGSKMVYKEWAPSAHAISIFGDFNQWNREEYQCVKDQFGHWSCDIDKPIPEFSKVKCQVTLYDHSREDRIPAWINYTIQNEDKTYDGVYVELGNYEWKHQKPQWDNVGIKIYQCHIGMAGIEEKVHSYTHFREDVLPRIVKLGYNVIQIMAVIEHPYYGSFGYHVTNFFSVSSRFGKPNEFKELVDEAHKQGIKVIIDIVHAHAAKNVNEGINLWDGTDYQYFHGGEKGNHPLWDSKIFNFSKYEVMRFLLSNIRFWMEEYNADGFRFDGVTSMLYKHHGASFGFTGNYDEYFNDNLETGAIVYLMLANKLAVSLYPQVILIAEDVSGLPGLCRSIEDGGIGFNFRLSMAIPDMWIKLLKETKDQDWDVEKIAHELTNRRWKEKTITYAESHDQALVGDKTISMWLFDAEIYTHMSVFNDETPRIFRGMALHKMIRLATLSLGGDGYLNFMGNEFGHPEWVDFPREGNNWSYHYCRRRWDLSTDKDLRFHFLNNFDHALIKLDQDHKILSNEYQYIRTKHNGDKIMIHEKGLVLFVFNWHCTQSFEKYPVYVRSASHVQVLFSTDDHQFGGHGRVAHQNYEVQKQDQFCGKFELYIPNRCAIVFKIHALEGK